MFEKLTIGDIVNQIPKSTYYFKKLGIDFCCGGSRLLKDVIHQMGLNEQDIYNNLNQLLKDSQDLKDKHNFTEMTRQELIDYIINKHHGYLRKCLPIIHTYLGAVMRAHGTHHPELFEIGKIYGVLSADLNQHIIKEETLVFPAFIESLDTVEDLSHIIIDEHVVAGQLLLDLRNVTNNYSIPSDACESYKNLYQLLEQLEEDTHIHVHLENNILFKDYDQR